MSEATSVTLTDFLLARIAEDDADARAAEDFVGGDHWHAVNGSVRQGERVDYPVVDWTGDAAPHVARHDPARVLAECEAKRRIVAEHPAPSYIGTPGARLACDRCSDLGGPYGYDDPANWIDWPCPTLRALASVYADHADFRDEWQTHETAPPSRS